MNNTNLNKYDIHISYQDVDSQSIVFHSRYIDFAEKARFILLKQLLDSLPDQKETEWIVNSLTIDYLGPARIGDVVSVITEFSDIKNVSFKVVQKFYINSKLIVKMLVRVASIKSDCKDLRLVKMPSQIRSKLIKLSVGDN